MPQTPLPVKEVYDLLKTEVTWLHGRWICYRQLFAQSEARINMLDECASAFFFIIQDVLFDEVQICLCKLTDPANTGKIDNLSLEQLQLRLEVHGDSGLSVKNRILLDALQTQATPFRTWRNKQLAHLDLQTSMQNRANPLPGVSRKMIDDALSLIGEYLNAIEIFYNDNEYGYENFIMGSDGNQLISILKYGLRYQELLDENKITYDDYRYGKWHDS